MGCSFIVGRIASATACGATVGMNRGCAEHLESDGLLCGKWFFDAKIDCLHDLYVSAICEWGVVAGRN